MHHYKIIKIFLATLFIIFSIGINPSLVSRTNEIQQTHAKFQNNVFQPELKNIIKANFSAQILNKLINKKTGQISPSLKSFASSKVDTPSTGFISTWNTTKTFLGSSNNTKIALPLESKGTYDFNVSWGDGNSNVITSYNQPEVTHTYPSPGVYTVNITGIIIGWRFNGSVDAINIVQISKWGPLRLGNDGYYFSGAQNMILTTTDALDLNGTTNFTGMFENCFSLGSSGNLDSWNVSQVKDMSEMFYSAHNFNQSLNSWNVTQVTDMSYMFDGATVFNQSIESWDVSNVTDMKFMFNIAFSFNQPLNSWNVSKVTDMRYMFGEAFKFNQPLDLWDVSHVRNLSFMFLFAINFNQSLNSWNVSQVTDMKGLFFEAVNFNQSLSFWDVSHVTDMSFMFFRAFNFSQALGSWNVTQVTNMKGMFYNVTLSTSNYDQLLRGWSSLPHLTHNVIFDAGNSKYSLSAQNAKDILTINLGWTITDGGLNSSDLATVNLVILIILIVIIIVIGIIAFMLFFYLKYINKLQNKQISKGKKIEKSKKELSEDTLHKMEEIIQENK